MKGKRIAIATGTIALLLGIVTVVVAWPRIRFWYFFEALGANAQGYPEYKHRQMGIVMVRLPGGKFWMGAQATDPNGQNYDRKVEKNEGPVHEVTLSPFLLAKYEVTQGQWLKVMGSNPSNFTGDENRPMEGVSCWEDIQEFEAKTGLVLPTESPWEYACRAGTTTPFAGKLEDLGWFDGNSGGESHQVGTKAPNGFGFHDLHGNVRELVEDVYDREFYGKPEASGPEPVSTAGSEFRVVRGGSYDDSAAYCRSSYRIGDRLRPGSRDVLLGFRASYYPVP